MAFVVCCCRLSIFPTELNRYGKGSKLSGFIYIYPISDSRFAGITARNFGAFRKLCDDGTLKNVILVTNKWGDVAREAAEARENELSGNLFKPALDKGARMARHYGTTQSAHDIIRMIIGNYPVPSPIQRELVDKQKYIIDTVAGGEGESATRGRKQTAIGRP